MLSLNCVHARTRTQNETQIELASIEVEKSFNELQVKEQIQEELQTSIDEQHQALICEQEHHLEWLHKRKSQLEDELKSVIAKIEEKSMILLEKGDIGE